MSEIPLHAKDALNLGEEVRVEHNTPAPQRRLKIALMGNPNCGKTSIFNILTGARQKVGNWGGVTVEVKQGTAHYHGQAVEVIDLPGTYSLSAYSLEEKVARDYIVDQRPDVVINVVDASNLERNLYLTVQLMELGVRPILAFNMWDEVAAKGLSIDTDQLSALLGVHIVPTIARNNTGMNSLLKASIEQGKEPAAEHKRSHVHVPEELEIEISSLANHPALKKIADYPSYWLSMKLFEYDNQIEELVDSFAQGGAIISKRDSAAEKIEKIFGEDTESLIAQARYGFIAGALRETVRRSEADRVEISDKIDTVLTHHFWAYPVFILFMWLLFQATFVLGEYPMGWIQSLFSWLATAVHTNMPAGNLRDLLVDGVIGGVGGVAVFLPNIMILFLGIAILEDTGYMARAAFIMDKVMHKMGLHGKSFIPMLVGMGCNVPAILSARTLESENDRIKTILLVPLISCSARLPVYVLFAGALFPRQAGNIVFLFQFVFGTLAFFLVGVVFKKTLFKGEDYPFVMELPPYRLPTGRSVLIHMWHRAEHYLKKMGGIVLAFSVILWFLGAFPKNPQITATFDHRIQTVKQDETLSSLVRQQRIDELQTKRDAQLVENSYIGMAGKVFAPIVKPLGFDWRGAVALMSGFVAKEVVVGSMGVLYAVGNERDAGGESLQAKIADNFTPLAALAFMAFVLLYTPCIVAFVTVVRELKSWRWSAFSLIYQLGLAWSVAFAIYQGGRILGFQ